MSDSIVFTGRNGAEVRDWVNEGAEARDPDESWFLTKGMSASTSAQAWNYARDGRSWPEKVKGAVYDVRTGTWVPVRAGDLVERQGSGYGVRTPR